MKRVLSLVLALVMVLGMIPTFAAEMTGGEHLLEHGFITGKPGDDVATKLDAGAALTRQELAALIAELMGEKEIAAVFAQPADYADADKIGAWAVPFVAYAQVNGWMSGKPGNMFDPTGPVPGQQLAAVLMNALGYTVDTQAKYATVIADAAALGVAVPSSNLTRGQAFEAMWTAVSEVKVNGEDVTLGVKLGKLDPPVEELTAGAAVVGAKKIEVTFSKPQETAPTFTVKRGTVSINIASVVWNEAKTIATLTAVSPFIAGDYTVAVSGIETPYALAIQAEKVTAIEILGDVAPLTAATTNITFNYVVRNQYGEDITSTTSLTWTASAGTFADPAVGVKGLNGTFTKGQFVVVSALHPTTGVFATKTLTVGDPARVASITDVMLYHSTNAELKANSTFGNYYLVVKALDQYGNKVTAAQMNSDITKVNTATNIVDITGNFVNVPGTSHVGIQLVKPGSNVAGNANITFISNYTGQSRQFVLTVGQVASLDQLIIQPPADLVVKGETVKLQFSALDQFGAELSETAKAALNSNIITSTDNNITFAFSYNYQTNKAELTMDLTHANVTTGSKVIMVVSPTGKVTQLSIDVKAAAKPIVITSTKDLVTNMTVDGTSTIKPSNIVVIDQYGRTMTLNAAFFAEYRINVATSDNTKVSVTGATLVATGSTSVLTGVATGNSTITLNVEKLNAPDAGIVTNSSFAFTASTVAKSAISEYVVNVPEVLYNADTHAKAIEVYGKLSNGTIVAIPASDYTVSTNNANVTYDDAVADKLAADGVTFGANITEVSVTVIVVIEGANGPQSVTKTVKISNVVPYLDAISVATDALVTITGGIAYVAVADSTIANVVDVFKGKDQYGVDFTMTITNVLVTNLVTDNTVTVSNNGQAAPAFVGARVAGDTFTVSIIADGGKTASVNVVVTP